MENGDGFGQVIGRINQQRLYRTQEVATLLQCSVRYVQVLVELGRLESLQVGRFIRIPGEELVRFINKYKEWDRSDGSNCKLKNEK
jgi:excisionase family DNA binding protein